MGQPAFAAWQHVEARVGFEVAFPSAGPGGGHRFTGATSAVEEGHGWSVDYELILGPDWATSSAAVTGRSERAGRGELTLETDCQGGWRVNGEPAPLLAGCVDVDLESSALTNAFPVHRLGLEVGEDASAPAAYVRALDLSVERLEQRYRRLPDDGGRQRYRYAAPDLGFECELLYDEGGLVLDYPGIARRVA